jgi:hypothetical protein
MAKIQIKSLESKNLTTVLDEKEAHKILGGLADSWHVYHGSGGKVIKREWESDGDDSVYHHYAP